jgi:hypothetical protein
MSLTAFDRLNYSGRYIGAPKWGLLLEFWGSMQFTKLGQSGLSVSRLCLGTVTFGRQTDEAKPFRIFDAASDAGVNLINAALQPVVLRDRARSAVFVLRRNKDPVIMSVDFTNPTLLVATS